MRIRSVRTWCLFFAMIVSITLAPLAVGSAPTSAQAATTEAAAATTHQFSDPVWFPLHKPANIGCANTGCDNSTGAHKVWAIDFLGAQGDPVYSAGAGIAHIGSNAGGCTEEGANADDPAHRGRWVWVDHGAGVVSQYRHLDSIDITEGQQVTPATVLGGMGNSGDSAPCTTWYVHFEIRVGGVNGTPVDPGQLNACTSSGKVRLPEIYGAKSWDEAKVHPRPRLKSPQADFSCADADWRNTPEAPVVEAKAAPTAAIVSWGDRPAGTTDVRVTLQNYRTSDQTWVGTTYTTVAADQASTSLTGLVNGRTYRVTAQFHNAAGWSNRAAWQEVVPAGKPLAPVSPRYLTWDKPYIHYGWTRSNANGSPVVSETVSWRCKTGSGAFKGWKTADQKPGASYRNISDVASFTTCEVKVRSTNAVGTGPYFKTSSISH